MSSAETRSDGGHIQRRCASQHQYEPVQQLRAGLDLAEALDVCASTPAGDMRRAVTSRQFPIKGDASRTVDAMIVAGDAAHPPLRLVLAEHRHVHIEHAFTKRLDAIRAQRSCVWRRPAVKRHVCVQIRR